MSVLLETSTACCLCFGEWPFSRARYLRIYSWMFVTVQNIKKIYYIIYSAKNSATKFSEICSLMKKAFLVKLKTYMCLLLGWQLKLVWFQKLSLFCLLGKYGESVVTPLFFFTLHNLWEGMVPQAQPTECGVTDHVCLQLAMTSPFFPLFFIVLISVIVFI